MTAKKPSRHGFDPYNSRPSRKEVGNIIQGFLTELKEARRKLAEKSVRKSKRIFK